MTHDKILQIVSEYYGINKNDILQRTRKVHIVEKRQMLHYVLREQYSFERIAFLTGYDHSTIIHSVKTIENYFETDKRVKQDYLNIIGLMDLYNKKEKIFQKADYKTNSCRKTNLETKMRKKMNTILYFSKLV